MASCSWELKVNMKGIDSGGFTAHFDMEQRVELNHKNKDIDKSKCHLNRYYGCKDWKDLKHNLKRRLKQAEENETIKSINKDRYTVQCLEIPMSEEMYLNGLDPYQFGEITHQYLQKVFGDRYCGSEVHVDEAGRHYNDADTGRDRITVHHVHAFVIMETKWDKTIKAKTYKDGHTRPESVVHEQGISAKRFASRENLIKLNNGLHEVYERYTGYQWNTGEKKKDRRSVEELKAQSAAKEREIQEEKLQAVITRLQGKEEELEELKEKYEKQQAEMALEATRKSELESQVAELQKSLISANIKLTEVEGKTTEENKKLQEVQDTLSVTTKAAGEVRTFLHSGLQDKTWLDNIWAFVDGLRSNEQAVELAESMGIDLDKMYFRNAKDIALDMKKFEKNATLVAERTDDIIMAEVAKRGMGRSR